MKGYFMPVVGGLPSAGKVMVPFFPEKWYRDDYAKKEGVIPSWEKADLLQGGSRCLVR